MRTCPKCTNGTIPADAYNPVARSCWQCDGVGYFNPPDLALLRDLVINPKTGKPWSTSFHSAAGRKRLANVVIVAPYAAGGSIRGVDRTMAKRAQYVWRMIGFNTGRDGRGANLGGAIMADMDLGADAYKRELDQIADLIADRCYGSGASLRSAKRWHAALHGTDSANDTTLDLFTK